MAKLLIPSRNRPASIENWLSYVAKYHHGVDIILADGSEMEYKDLYRKIVKKYTDRLQIDYRPYDPKVQVFDRILDVLKNESAEYFIMAADDDYPLLDLLLQGEQFLRDNPDYMIAMGGIVSLSLAKSGKLSAKFRPARPVVSNSVISRVTNYSRWHFPTTYAVTRREHLIERYHRASILFLAGFYDFSTGIHDCSVGKIKALDSIGYICTKNYNHSYFRPKDKLFFLRRGDEVLQIRDRFYSDLMLHNGISSMRAQVVSDKLIKNRIAGLVNRGSWSLPGFSESPLFTNSLVQSQYSDFHGMFTDGHPIRKRLHDKLSDIVKGMQLAAVSNDNSSDNGNYETVEAQINDYQS